MIPNGVLYPYNKIVFHLCVPGEYEADHLPGEPADNLYVPTQGPQARTVSINYPLGGFTAS